MDEALARTIRVRRVVYAWLWGVVLGVAVLGRVFEPELVMLAWVGGVALTVVTLASARASGDERLVRPRLYRIVAAALLASALAGVVFGLVPGANAFSQGLAIYFGLVAFLAYRAVMARGPRASLVTMLIAIWTWIPPLVVTLMGCKCGRNRGPDLTHWTEPATQWTLQITLGLLVVSIAAALISWAPRTDNMPGARVIKSREN